LHIPIVQRPIEHAAVALGRRHALPHAPQLAALVPVSTSQPSSARRLQSAKPGLQVYPHVPVARSHVGAAFGGTGQALPQRPQFVTDRSSSSQPLASLPSQLPKGSVHEPTAHIPLRHAGVALGRRHTVPHAPQLPSFVRTSTQVAPQHESPEPAGQGVVGEQLRPQAKFWQNWPIGHWESCRHSTH
jgi:hypothetical protein